MSKINPTTETFEQFEQWVESTALMLKDGEYVCDETAKENYINAVKALNELALQGKCNLKADDYRKPYIFHAIYVEWKYDEDGFLEPDTNLIIKALTEMDLTLTEDSPFMWQIGTEIYSPVN